MPETLSSPLVRSILNALFIGFVGFLAAYLTSKLFAVLFSRVAWARFVGNLLALGIVIWTISLILNQTGAVGVIVILATAFTGALSLGSEHVASDLVCGVKIFTTRPFQTGDVVSVADNTGEILEIAAMYTVLAGDGGQRVIIRNSDVVAGTIIKHALRPESRVQIELSVPASEDLEQVIAAIQDGLKDFSPKSLKDAPKPSVVCETVSEQGRLNVSVSAYVAGSQDLNIEKTRLMVATLRALREHNLKLGV